MGKSAPIVEKANIRITGVGPLLLNNPQTVDPFNHFAKAMKVITRKRMGKTEDDLLELGRLERHSKMYFDDTLGVYVPTRWTTEAICLGANAVAKIGKAKMRGGIFATEEKAKLHYDGMSTVKAVEDVVDNAHFTKRMILPQGQVRVTKDFPIFHKWWFETTIEFDNTVVDFSTLARIVERTAYYVGFGDFRPTFGRATAEVNHV